MPRVRPLELKALLPLLEQDWPDEVDDEGGLLATGQERLIEGLILALDEVRASRISFIGVLKIGYGPTSVLLGMGPYPGRRSAEKAVAAHPAVADRTLCTGAAVVPIETPQGIAQRLKELDAKRKKELV
jgi:hypothetical protein